MKDDEAYLLCLTKAVDEIGKAIANAQEETRHKLDNLWRESKVKTLNSGVTLAELTEKALRKFLKEEGE